MRIHSLLVLACLFLTVCSVVFSACGGDKAHTAKIAGDVADILEAGCVLLVDIDTGKTIENLCHQAEPLWPLVETVAGAIPDSKVRTVKAYDLDAGGAVRAVTLSTEAVKKLRAVALEKGAVIR